MKNEMEVNKKGRLTKEERNKKMNKKEREKGKRIGIEYGKININRK